MEFIKTKSQRGRDLLILEQYIYNFDKKMSDKERWRCRNRACKAVVYVNEGIFDINNAHNHNTEEKAIERLLFNERIKLRAKKTSEKSNSIIVQETMQIPEEKVISISKTDSIKKLISRERSKSVGLKIMKFVDIPEILRLDHQKNNFMLFDSGIEDDNRFVIFSSFFKQRFISRSDIWIVDGTFRSCPSDFFQLFTIHIYVFGKTFPAFYVLLKNKRESSYEKLFRYISENLKIIPKVIIADFEIAIYNSAMKVFMNVDYYFCFFHYAQSIYRRLSTLGFSSQYKTEPSFSKTIKKLFVLPFFSLDRIKAAYESIESEIFEYNNPKLLEFLEYYKRTFFGTKDMYGDYKNSLYHPQNWNCSKRTMLNILRTTNNVEGWHRSFNESCVVANPNIAVVIGVMKDEEELNRIEILKIIDNGINARTDFKKEEKIRLLVQNQEFYTDSEFFNSLSKIFKWNFE